MAAADMKRLSSRDKQNINKRLTSPDDDEVSEDDVVYHASGDGASEDGDYHHGHGHGHEDNEDDHEEEDDDDGEEGQVLVEDEPDDEPQKPVKPHKSHKSHQKKSSHGKQAKSKSKAKPSKLKGAAASVAAPQAGIPQFQEDDTDDEGENDNVVQEGASSCGDCGNCTTCTGRTDSCTRTRTDCTRTGDGGKRGGRWGWARYGYNRGWKLWAGTFLAIIFVIGLLMGVVPFRVHTQFATQFVTGFYSDASTPSEYSAIPWAIMFVGWMLVFIAVVGSNYCTHFLRFVGSCCGWGWGRGVGGECKKKGCGCGGRAWYQDAKSRPHGFGFGRFGCFVVDWVQVFWVFTVVLLATFLDGLIQCQKIQWDVPSIYYIHKIILGTILFYIAYRIYLETQCLKFECNLLITSLVVTILLHFTYWFMGFYFNTFVLGFFVLHFLFLWLSALILAWFWGRERLMCPYGAPSDCGCGYC